MKKLLICNDCISELKTLVSNGTKVSLTVTSPPYFNARDYSRWDSYDSYLLWLEEVFKEIYNITEDGRMCCVNTSPVIEPRLKRSMESTRYPIPFDLCHILKGIGWKFLEDIVWVKPEGSVPNRNGGFYRHRKPVAYKPNSITEYIFVFQKPMNGLIDKIVGSIPDEIMKQSLVADDYERTNVWRFNPETKSNHPAPFPIELPNRLIRYYSFVGETVLDPFMGSGTTCLSAKNLLRGYIGIEKDEKYFDISVNRLKE